jgi:hypothetical protein
MTFEFPILSRQFFRLLGAVTVAQRSQSQTTIGSKVNRPHDDWPKVNPTNDSWGKVNLPCDSWSKITCQTKICHSQLAT